MHRRKPAGRRAGAIVLTVLSAVIRPAAQEGPVTAPSPLGIVSAVESTLAHHPVLEAQRLQVTISRAVKQQRTGLFDTAFEAAASDTYTKSPTSDAEKAAALAAGVPVRAFAENVFGVRASAQKLTRSGITFGPTLSLDRVTDNGSVLDGLNRARIGFDASVPLLQGRGRLVVAGPETIASLQVEASSYDLGQQASDLVLGTATSYWQYVAALRQLEFATESEARGLEYLQAVKTLVEADRLPRAEVSQAQANFDSSAAGRYGLEQQVVEARTALALAMGLTADQVTLMPPPVDALPAFLGEVPPSSDRLPAFIALALARRADVLASGRKLQAADVQRTLAADRVRSRLDLTLSTGVSNLRAGRGADDLIASPFTGGAGADAVVGVRWARTASNTTALGERAEAEASYRQAVWLHTDRTRSISAGVVNAVTALQHGYARLSKAAAAVTGYESALEGERDKLRLGLGSITDLLTVEGRLNGALTDLLAAQQAYAIGIVRLRYACGTLVDPLDPRVPPRDVFFRPEPGAGGQP
jgi:outer membrane protein TolC